MIIPVEPEGDPGPCLAALRAAWPRGLRGEAFVARGRHPSRQRNAAVAAARGRLLYFLDSDSLAQAGSITRLAAELADPGVAAAGGPNLPRLDEPWLGRVFSQILASRLGSGASRARYAAVGAPRDAGEKELILCNLMMRRRTYAGAGGLREDLYPNEENELLNRLRDQGWRSRYRPDAAVRRPRRRTDREFVWQAFRYGRGRMQQVRANPHLSDLPRLLPAALFLYFLLAPPLAFVTPSMAPLLFLPAAAYLGAVGLAAWWLAAGMSNPYLPDLRALHLIAALLPLRHLAYGAGLLAGLIPHPPPGGGEVKLQRVRLAAAR